ncbi:TIGR03086 family metal-binding protein [Motilibacter aurantiacus]|uniref:TIGR03086 family metal-binding protein n=1 Tax=Motilibacter aurantiacus TaxID=2714955 RepID=UPI0014094382|nr:TIGR03086 family metal-binding protein [Motilibacter aurantiacus]NHC44496.1 TIGR03086 family protein [Motilibacter aurantiacus]
MLDLTPTARTVAGVVAGVRDDQLAAPTPCPDLSVGALLHHLEGVCLGFTAAARKDPVGGSAAPVADAAELRPGWRDELPGLLAMVAEAWLAPAAWAGPTRVGGIDLPGEAAGVFALDELMVHGWDLAAATGRPYHWDEGLTVALHAFLQGAVEPDGTPGLFGPPVPVPDGAPLGDRVLGLTGRDPQWRPAVAHA